MCLRNKSFVDDILEGKETLDTGVTREVTLRHMLETLEGYCMYPLDRLTTFKFECDIGPGDWKLLRQKCPNLKVIHYQSCPFEVSIAIV
jgi:hypothetical protein